MDTNNFRISIPKPCHEDWNKFTPDEKGAFCKVCSKSVHDFTKKTAEEIKAVLIEETGAGKKVCGRFNEDQLTPGGDVVHSFFPALDPYSLNFQKVKKFALAVFLVFGGYLFNTVKSSAQKTGKVAYTPQPAAVNGEVSSRYIEYPKDTISDAISSRSPEILKTPKCSVTKGDVAFVPEVKTVTSGKVEVDKIEILGQAIIATSPLLSDSVKEIENTDDVSIPLSPLEDTLIDREGESVEEPMVMGLIALPYVVETDSIINPVPADSIQDDLDGEFAVAESTDVEVKTPTLKREMQDDNGSLSQRDSFRAAGEQELSISSYPNPSSNGIITLRYNLKKDGMASISIFDLNGSLVKTLLPAESLYASSYETKYDVSDLRDGIYFCELISKNNKVTTRIVISR